MGSGEGEERIKMILDLLVTWFTRQIEAQPEVLPVEIIDRGIKIAALEEKRKMESSSLLDEPVEEESE